MKNKTKKITRIAVAILLVIAIQAMGITYAKYYTLERATGSTGVAKWAFKIVKDETQTKSINLADTVNKDTLIDGKIAPGTTGAINIELDGTGSEVDLDYTIQFANEKNKPKNITFTRSGTEYKSLSEMGTITGNIKHTDSPMKSAIVIFWTWDYETGETPDAIATNDVIDTQDANTISEYTFDVVATGTQSE